VNFFGGAAGNFVGGTAPGARNVISGNTLQGVLVQDPGSSTNVIQGNFIGLNPAGTGAIPNGSRGVDVYNGPVGTWIGGASPGSGNVISGNSDVGVYIHVATLGNVVQGNYIGLDAAGALAVTNAGAGVQISEGAQSNLVGGPLPAMRNVISGNELQGVLVAGTNTTGNLVQGNRIGLNAAGTAAVPNGACGIDLAGGASGNLVGGTMAGARNAIAGNGAQGVLLQDPGTSSNVVQGNFIGVANTGLSAISNRWSGVEISGGPQGNLIGGAGAGNLISGNGNYGVVLAGLGSLGNTVAGNWIGVNVTGNAAVPNAYAGVGLFGGAQANVVGGALPGLGNVISGNASQGIAIGDSGTSGNLIQDNLIGLDVTGSSAVPNQGWAGIDIFTSASGNVIGGGIGARNTISGNSGRGISLSGNASGHIIQGNTIGLDATSAAAVPNGGAGVILFGGALSNQLGGVTVAAGNFIADNLSDGVQMYDAATAQNAVRGNSVFGNAGLGIALNTGANNSAAAPMLRQAILTTSLTVTGNLASLPSTTFHLDFYRSPPPLGGAAGKTYLGTRDVATGAGGTANFSVVLGAIVPIGHIITATATDPVGNTSPFSAGVTVTGTDSVGDGLPNAWRAAWFGGAGTTTNSQSCATCDPDRDGLNNLQEFLAGTNPTNATSVLRLAVAIDGVNATLSFQSANGIAYRLDSREVLGSGSWSVLAEPLLGSGGLMQVVHPGAAQSPRQFYRLVVEP